jgi:outer membrane protein OmpA-like peptidoglycan-associated protein
MNTYTYLYRSKNNGKLVIDTSRYGLSSAYMFNQIRDEHWDNPYHSVYYKYCKLTKPVKKGQMIKAGFEYVYLPATDQIIFNSGLYFTKDKPKVNDIEFILNSPQILNKEQQTTKETWFTVVDSFIAETDINWVTIGIFSNKSDWVIDRSNMKNYGTGLDKVKPENAKNLGFRVHYDNVFADVIPIRERLEKFMIYFDMSNSILAEAQIASLKKGMSSIDKSKLASIVLTGYTDDQGSEILNKALSMKRANYIRSLLQKEMDVKVDIVATGKGVSDQSEDPTQQRNVTVNLVYK